jgi:hypothetical protein
MPTIRTSAQWRALAAQARAMAAELTDLTAKQDMLAIAKVYDRTAEQIEQSEK